jgi:hypothetical protein
MQISEKFCLKIRKKLPTEVLFYFFYTVKILFTEFFFQKNGTEVNAARIPRILNLKHRAVESFLVFFKSSNLFNQTLKNFEHLIFFRRKLSIKKNKVDKINPYCISTFFHHIFFIFFLFMYNN